MPSLRSSIRKRRQAEESNPVEQNPVEEAAKEAIQKQLDERPEPVEPKPDQMQGGRGEELNRFLFEGAPP